MFRPRPSRRTLIKLAGAGLAAEAFVALDVRAAQGSPPAARIWSAEYTAKKGQVSLAMFRKRLGAPHKGEPAKPVLFMVHGSSISSRPTFDLTVPGKGEYSLMNVFASYGFDVWTLDHESYGRSTEAEGNSDIASGVEEFALRPLTHNWQHIIRPGRGRRYVPSQTSDGAG